jgi:hypothetical protein
MPGRGWLGWLNERWWHWFYLTPSLGMINLSIIGCQVELKTTEGGQEGADKPKSVGNPLELSSQTKKESRNNCG